MTNGHIGDLERYHGIVRDDVLQHLERGNGKLLDIGGGTGATALKARELGLASIVGVADQIAGNPDLDFSYQGDLENEQFLEQIVANEGKFDIILANDILEHLVDPWTTVSRLHKGLKPNGLLVASIPNVRELNSSLPLFFSNKWTYTEAGILDRTHLRFFVKSTAIELIACSGLKIKKVAPSVFSSRKIRLFRLLTLGLLNSFTDRQYIVVGQNTDQA